MQIQHLLTTLVVLPAACIAAALPAAGSRDLITPRSPIVGGKPQTPGSYPFVVAISRRTQEPGVDGFLCGGTLVSSNVVLTARHCFDGNLTARDLRVNAGSNRRDKGIPSLVRHIKLHPSEASLGNSPVYGDYHLDVAILILNSELLDSFPNIGYARLPDVSNPDPPKNTLVLAMGWGLRKKPDPNAFRIAADYPRERRGVFLTTISPKECADVNNKLDPPGKYPLCIQHLVKDRTGSFCNKDAGGPVIDEKRRLLGVLSRIYGGCGVPGSITVSTSVRDVVEWVQNVIEEYSRH